MLPEDPMSRITSDPSIMGGKPCIRGLRITVACIVRLLANGASIAEVLAEYPELQEPDIRAALAWAAWRMDVDPPGTQQASA